MFKSIRVKFKHTLRVLLQKNGAKVRTISETTKSRACHLRKSAIIINFVAHSTPFSIMTRHFSALTRRLIFGSASLLLAASLMGGCKKEQSSLEARFPEKFEGKTVEMVSFADSAILSSGVVRDGRVLFDNADILSDTPRLVELTIDGRVKAFAVIEPGKAVLSDSLHAATGTPLNDRFATLMARLDSVESLDDINAYVDFADRQYADNRENPLGQYFALEVIKFAEPARVDSLLAILPADFKESRKARRFIRFAELRKGTAPGNTYTDFSAPDKNGRDVKLSDLIVPGHYTIVDFWASWCPWCIKELPRLKEILDIYGGKGVDIVGVAVRDKIEDTENSVARHEIPWRIMYNAQRVPYDIYGFTGIPHLMLIGPDGKIIARGESADQTAKRLETILAD